MEVFGLSRSKTPNRQVKGTYLVADRTSSKAIGEIINVESAHKVVKKVKTPSPSQPTRKLGSSCTNLTI
jgi:hypothetical protein